MNQTVEAGKTLLVDGPACVKINGSCVEVLGFSTKDKRIVVREGKRLPFFMVEKTSLDISLGTDAKVTEVDGNTVPQLWIEIFQSLLNQQNKPATILVLGKTDSGKSSFCTYLTNKLVYAKKCVAVLDGDIGQADIGPPGTISYALAAKPTIELNDLKLENAFFIGVTSPAKALSQTLEGYDAMKNEVLKKNPDFIVVNTDGWVTREEALDYKLKLIEALKPDLIVAMQIESELEPLLSKITGTPVKVVKTSPSIKERNPQVRHKLRQKNYSKFLKEGKVRMLYMNQYEIANKADLPFFGEEPKGLLVGFKNRRKKFLGIGVLIEVNNRKKALQVFTPVTKNIAAITIGKVHLNKQ
jgi:polynucleotide 5'-hydroxyl-kinase GRC3/NOL9